MIISISLILRVFLILILLENITCTPRDFTEYRRKSASTRVHRISKADAENSKFLGAYNQEDIADDIEQKTLRKFKRRRNRYNRRPCYHFRNAPSTQAEARFLWDVNIYHIHDDPIYINCGGFADDDIPARPGFFQNFLSLFVPGVLQNAQGLSDSLSSGSTGTEAESEMDLENDPGLDYVDDNFQPSTPRPILYDSQGAPPLTPSQVVGGVAQTVNEIIQRLTGNSRPVYQSRYQRQSSYRRKRANPLRRL